LGILKQRRHNNTECWWNSTFSLSLLRFVNLPRANQCFVCQLPTNRD
jgi:hypothetical protein